MGRPLTAFSYYGGKSQHLRKFLYPHFPPEGSYWTYVEPYMGGLSVLLNKPRVKTEIVNDLNDDLVNFFRVLRERPDELIHQITLTPYARSEYAASAPDPFDTSLERARKLFVRMHQGYGGLPVDVPSIRKWVHPRKPRCGDVSNVRGKESGFQNALSVLDQISARLQGVAIECRDALTVIRQYDNAGAFFYVDPPYVHSTRVSTTGYHTEASDQDHRELAAVLHRIEGRAALSGYRCPLYDELYTWWYRYDRKTGLTGGRTESLWTNFSPGKGA